MIDPSLPPGVSQRDIDDAYGYLDEEPEPMYDEEYPEPSPEDYTMTPTGELGCMIGVGQIEGKFLGEFHTTDDAFNFIKQRMEKEQFWPNIWWVSDHGNWSLFKEAF